MKLVTLAPAPGTQRTRPFGLGERLRACSGLDPQIQLFGEGEVSEMAFEIACPKNAIFSSSVSIDMWSPGIGRNRIDDVGKTFSHPRVRDDLVPRESPAVSSDDLNICRSRGKGRGSYWEALRIK
jgi:hypothetical protein